MIKNPYPGKFIVFDGLDGSGQSTQAELLKDFLNKKGVDVVLTKEPTLQSEAGNKLREILGKKIKISPESLQELFAKDREGHLKNVIIPNLKKGKTVISDRYFFSSFAYGVSEGIDLERLVKINNNFLAPDLTFLLKASPETCVLRIEKRGREKTLFEEKDKLAKVWQVYETLPQRFDNIKIINSEGPIKKVFVRVKNLLS